MNIKNLDINVKKVLATLSAGALMFTFTGCNNSSSKVDSSSESSITQSSNVDDSTSKIIIDEYQEVRGISETTGISVMELRPFIEKYSNLSHHKYSDSIEVIKKNMGVIQNEYNKPKAGIMCVLFDDSYDKKILRCDCPEELIERKEMTQDEQEGFILEMCDNYGMTEDEKAISLSIFRLETGNGTSDLCKNDNNYGGIRLLNGEFGKYQTPYYGMYEALCCIKKYIDAAKEQGITDIGGIVNYTSQFYCGDTAYEWTTGVMGLVPEVQEYYGFNNSKTI